MSEWPAKPVAGGAQDCQIGFYRLERGFVDLGPFSCLPAEALKDDVATLYQLVYQAEPLWFGEVDRAAFLALQHLRTSRLREGKHASDVVAVERFDLDDSRTEVGEQRGAVRPGEHRPEFEDRHPMQRKSRSGVVSSSEAGRLPTQPRHRRIVLPDARRWTQRREWLAIGVDQRRRLAHQAEFGVVHRHRAALMNSLGMVQ